MKAPMKMSKPCSINSIKPDWTKKPPLEPFLWAVKTGQFSDQERARYIPLRDDPIYQDKPDNSAYNPVVLGLAVILLLALAMIGVMVILSIRWMG